MISEVLHSALAATAANRSENSWIAGSAVIAHLIDRVPNDIDLHHIDRDEFHAAIERDLRALLAGGFTPVARTEYPLELEINFSHVAGEIGVNWVLEPHRPTRLLADAEFGVRASLPDIVVRKIAMFKDDHLPKHTDDLACLLRHIDQIDSEISAIELARDVRAATAGLQLSAARTQADFVLFRELVKMLTGFDDIGSAEIERNFEVLREECESPHELDVLLDRYIDVLEARPLHDVSDCIRVLAADHDVLPTMKQVAFLFFLGAVRKNARWKRCGWPQYEGALVWRALQTHPPLTRGRSQFGDWSSKPAGAGNHQDF